MTVQITFKGHGHTNLKGKDTEKNTKYIAQYSFFSPSNINFEQQFNQSEKTEASV